MKIESLCEIRDIQRAVCQFEFEFVKLHGICLNEGMALCSLSKTGKLSSGELGELLGLSSSNTSKVIRSIESKGLIKRVLGIEDRRQMYFLLTDKGKRLLSEIKCEEIQIPDSLKTVVNKL